MGCFFLSLWLAGSFLPAQQSATSQQQEVANAPASQPSLVDLAKAQQSSRKDPSEVRLIRNEDLASLKGARVSTGSAKKAGAKTGQEVDEKVLSDEAADKPAAEAEGLDLQFWTGAFNEARMTLQTAVNQRMVLELRMNNLRNSYFQTADGTTREKVEADISECWTQLEQAREDEKAALQAVEELRRQAAKAGLTPGQIRDLEGELPESKSSLEGVPQSIGNS